MNIGILLRHNFDLNVNKAISTFQLLILARYYLLKLANSNHCQLYDDFSRNPKHSQLLLILPI